MDTHNFANCHPTARGPAFQIPVAPRNPLLINKAASEKITRKKVSLGRNGSTPWLKPTGPEPERRLDRDCNKPHFIVQHCSS